MKISTGLISISLVFSTPLASGASDDQREMMHQHNSGMEHSAMMQHGASAASLTEGGQAAFAAIQEIVAVLLADPKTDWENVNIEALRQHLIDMDNVTLRAKINSEPIDGGARFSVTSETPSVQASIRNMTLAHASTMDGTDGISFKAEESENGAFLVATGDAKRIRGLGYIGLMTAGMHHQVHHLALARGEMPH